MTEELRVTPEALQHAGAQIERNRETLAAVQQSWHDQAQGAQHSWVGSSAGALAALLDSWAETGRAQLRRIGEQARALHDAAAEFAFLEQRGSASLTYPSGSAPVR